MITAGMDHLFDTNRVDDFFGDQELVELARDETRVTLGSRGIDIACTGVRETREDQGTWSPPPIREEGERHA
jgi:hypothetical protein